MLVAVNIVVVETITGSEVVSTIGVVVAAVKIGSVEVAVLISDPPAEASAEAGTEEVAVGDGMVSEIKVSEIVVSAAC